MNIDIQIARICIWKPVKLTNNSLLIDNAICMYMYIYICITTLVISTNFFATDIKRDQHSHLYDNRSLICVADIFMQVLISLNNHNPLWIVYKVVQTKLFSLYETKLPAGNIISIELQNLFSGDSF